MGIIILKKNITKAFSYYTKAHDKGNVHGTYKLGLCYQKGRGVKQNLNNAYELFLLAAKKEYHLAQRALGNIYEKGIGKSKDLKEAMKWFIASAKSTDTPNTLLYKIGKSYLEGKGVDIDEKQGVFWLEKASKKNNIDAKNELERREELRKISEYVQKRLLGTFTKTKERLDKKSKLMGLLFCIGLLMLFSMCILFLLFYSKSSINFEIIYRFLIASPIIWGTWFSGRQYSQINKLREDYAFKESIAMTYDGYKDLAINDDFFKQRLIEMTIRAFGENPTRLLSKNDPCTPQHEMMQTLEALIKIKNGS